MLDAQLATIGLGHDFGAARAPAVAAPRRRIARTYTLMDLVAAVSSVTDSDAEVVAVVTSLLESGQVKLAGRPADSAVRISRL
jgi:hypothetical protein